MKIALPVTGPTPGLRLAGMILIAWLPLLACVRKMDPYGSSDLASPDRNRGDSSGLSGDRGDSDGSADGAGGTPAWVVVPKGTFTMGSPAAEPCRIDFEDLHTVTLTRAFEMQSTEVTQGEFQNVMGYNPAELRACGASCPVETVSWHEAAAYCNALSSQRGLTSCYTCSNTGPLVVCAESVAHRGAAFYGCPGYRLPTDAEWEHAYRAGTSTAFHDGTAPDGKLCMDCQTLDPNADRIGWYCANTQWATRPVAGKLPNAWGLFDLAGNVREWVNDFMVNDLGNAPVTDPWGAASGENRLIRGAGHSDPTRLLRAAYRIGRQPGERGPLFGFRCVRSRP